MHFKILMKAKFVTGLVGFKLMTCRSIIAKV